MMRLIRRKVIVKPKPAPLDPARPLPFGLEWYVLITQPNREYHVAHWREELGDMTLTPLETRVKLADNERGGRFALRKFYQIPVFPRFVLVGFFTQPNWLAVMDNYHITGVLGFNGTPAPMRKGEAERIRESSEALRQVAHPIRLEDAKRARIIAPGLFTGHVVEIASLQGKKVRTIQDWFGQKREVEMHIDDLESVA